MEHKHYDQIIWHCHDFSPYFVKEVC